MNEKDSDVARARGESERKVLFLVTCSYTKEKKGDPNYLKEKSILSKLKNPDVLLNGRKTAYEIIQKIDYQGAPLKENPNNLALEFSHDFGGEEKGLFLEAIERYRGHFYRSLGSSKEARKAVLESKHNILIISGLYGLLTPEEHIQLYECALEHMRPFYNNWVKDDLLTNVLIDYIDSNEISVIVDLTSQHEYRNLIFWKRLYEKKGLYVLHGHCKIIAGPQVLPDFGTYMKDFLLKKEASAFHVLRTPVENYCCLTHSLVPPKSWPIEQSLRIQRALEEGESFTSEFKKSLTGGTYDVYNNIQKNQMKYRCMKSICSLINSEGGELLVGVDDKTNQVVGIGRDLEAYNYSTDDYLHIVDRLVLHYLGKELVQNVRPKIWSYNKMPVLMIEVIKGSKPAYLRYNIQGYRANEYWIRGNKGDMQLHR